MLACFPSCLLSLSPYHISFFALRLSHPTPLSLRLFFHNKGAISVNLWQLLSHLHFFLFPPPFTKTFGKLKRNIQSKLWHSKTIVRIEQNKCEKCHLKNCSPKVDLCVDGSVPKTSIFISNPLSACLVYITTFRNFDNLWFSLPHIQPCAFFAGHHSFSLYFWSVSHTLPFPHSPFSPSNMKCLVGCWSVLTFTGAFSMKFAETKNLKENSLQYWAYQEM